MGIRWQHWHLEFQSFSSVYWPFIQKIPAVCSSQHSLERRNVSVYPSSLHRHLLSVHRLRFYLILLTHLLSTVVYQTMLSSLTQTYIIELPYLWGTTILEKQKDNETQTLIWEHHLLIGNVYTDNVIVPHKFKENTTHSVNLVHGQLACCERWLSFGFYFF